jgi:hypothetical protein
MTEAQKEALRNFQAAMGEIPANDQDTGTEKKQSWRRKK